MRLDRFYADRQVEGNLLRSFSLSNQFQDFRLPRRKIFAPAAADIRPPESEPRRAYHGGLPFAALPLESVPPFR